MKDIIMDIYISADLTTDRKDLKNIRKKIVIIKQPE